MLTPLKRLATEIRLLEMEIFKARGFGHIGGSMSMTDLLAALYGRELRFDPQNPKWGDRDRIVCSKGHAGPAMYAALAYYGYFPKEWLYTMNEPHTRLPSHCDRVLTPGIDMTAGSLGQGCLAAGGMALGLKVRGSEARVFAILGDGELDEGSPWEMISFAPSKKLNNFFVFVDRNFKQLDGYTEGIIALRDLEKQFGAFGWYAQTVKDGNNPDAIAAAIDDAKIKMGDRPAAFILNTVKGAGFKEVEEQEWNHFVTVTPEQSDRGIEIFRNMLEEDQDGGQNV
jgi:transketolase